ncbi:MAG: protein translocase subunit SecF, partial [Oscillospiraceae bacterium]|nr:protein translocase subunit SecF [Oscillospiraceae bacterium]
MKKSGKTWFFVVLALILALTYCAFFGVSGQNGDMQTKYIKGAADIRFGIDIRGGVDVTFVPNLTPEEIAEIGHERMVQDIQSAKTVMEMRLVGMNITDYEMYTDENNYRIILRFPWKVGETAFNPEEAIQEIATTAKLTFHEGFENTEDTLILEGANVVSATSGVMNENGQTLNVVSLKLDQDGAKAFGDATARLAAKGYISIFMDDTCISTAFVKTAITDGEAIISGKFEAAEAKKLASQINSGALPFALSAESYSTISPTLGSNSLQVMVEAGIVAFILIALFMTLVYRLPGF